MEDINMGHSWFSGPQLSISLICNMTLVWQFLFLFSSVGPMVFRAWWFCREQWWQLLHPPISAVPTPLVMVMHNWVSLRRFLPPLVWRSLFLMQCHRLHSWEENLQWMDRARYFPDYYRNIFYLLVLAQSRHKRLRSMIEKISVLFWWVKIIIHPSLIMRCVVLRLQWVICWLLRVVCANCELKSSYYF